MSALAPTLQAFFTDRLARQRQASPETVAAYRECLGLTVSFASRQVHKEPSQLDIGDLDAPLITAFLDSLEQQRRNTVRTRNARLAAVHSLFRYAALRHPEHAAVIQRVLAIPPKRFDRALINFLTRSEVDALPASPDRSTRTGLRASELTRSTCGDIHLGSGPHVSCHGKGRKDRITPLLTGTVTTLKNWLAERAGGPSDPLFATRRGRTLTRDAIEHRLAKHTASAAERCPSLHSKRVSAHVLRHTSAMQLLRAGVDTAVIALWLGHERVETTQIYLHADLRLKEQALARTKPPTTKPGRFRPSDSLLAFLESL
jgi:site-specific recombinase XerD